MTAAELLVPPLAPVTLVYSLCVVFAAGIVRGFAGFGFSAITVAGMSLVVSPALVVPAIFMLEILASPRPAARRRAMSTCLGSAG